MRLGLAAILALAVCTTVGMTAGGATAAKKKKKKGPSVFKQQRAANLAVPDAPATGTATAVTSTITVPKSFKGKSVGDLDLTGLQITGAGAGDAGDIALVLTAPSGLTMTITNPDNNSNGDQNIGPWTLNDDTPTSICDSATLTCEDPQQTLLRPFAGTSNAFAIGGSDTGPLSAFDGTPMRGTWTLTAYDESNTGTAVVNSWGLAITPARPVTGGKKKAFSGTANPNAAVPDDAATGPSTPITSTITVPKSFKGRVVGDLNVTGIRTTGSGVDAPDDLEFRLTAPNGTAIRLLAAGSVGDDFVSLGPVSFDDDTPTSICSANPPPCENPLESLNGPHAGTANLLFLGTGGTGPLSSFNGLKMNGTWTLTVWDEVDAGTTSVLNGWGLKITPAQPVRAPKRPRKAGSSAKKKAKSKSKFAGTATPNAAVPDDAAAGPSAEVVSTIKVGKKFKGRVIGDLNVTGIRTTGAGATAADDLTFTLVGPTGRAVRLIDEFALNGQSIAGLTLDDDVKASRCDDTTPPCDEPIETLSAPFAGTVNMRELESGGTAPLSTFDGTRMKGTWTLHVSDTAGAGDTSVFNSWGLKITAAKPTR